MHKSLTILLVLFFAGKSWAQEEATEPIKLRTEIGFQTNALFGRLTSAGENSLVQNPYLLTGKLVLGNIAIRTGLGGAHGKQVDRVEGFANTITTLVQQLDLRLGAERRFPLGDRWQGNLGVDAVANWTQNKTVNDSGFDEITDYRDLQYIGGGMAIGIKYQATKRLSFCTEGYLYYTVGKLTEGQFFKNFPVGEDKIKESDTSAMQIGLPSALYIVLEF